ncbi:P-loop containing nucleoside triphosphate hydrolase protein [Delitschia confertaspora ATCC 74209]|uniref:P-loop containing nucleoside triphosphate hydrolase protein n=1 Tax=Delitschia confertaspora ATCC 74209 TaxID=1513339 RepID=A0A9P4N161_9PLEO|nr:P-loop containing nucleoside triphosphate hydrolase protein [Delitschia confertaspora ATCC 74209]
MASSTAVSDSPGEDSAKLVVILGESGVGKTCLLDQFVHGKHFANYDPTAGLPVKSLEVDGKTWNLRLIDLDSTLLREGDNQPEFRVDFFINTLRDADGIIFLYDITSRISLNELGLEAYPIVVTTRTRPENDYERPIRAYGRLLVGNKADLANEKREVSKEEGEEAASMLGMDHLELDTSDTEAINDMMKALVRRILVAERKRKHDGFE